jgi:hypothetical protein
MQTAHRSRRTKNLRPIAMGFRVFAMVDSKLSSVLVIHDLYFDEKVR